MRMALCLILLPVNMFIQRTDKQPGRGIGVALLAIMFLVGCAGGQPDRDRSSGLKNPSPRDFEPEKVWQELDVPISPFPREENLAEFTIIRATSYQFFVDTQSVSVGSDGVVRYALVARSEAGAENVSFEGIRCRTREFTVYAFGTVDQTWSQARKRKWARIERSRSNDPRFSLYRYYLCRDGSPHRNARDAIAALEHGQPEVTSGPH